MNLRVSNTPRNPALNRLLGVSQEEAHRELSVLSFYFRRRLGENKDDIMQSYKQTVHFFHEGLYRGKSFATVDDTHWEQRALTGTRNVDKSGNITVPSDIEEVRIEP